MKIFSRFLISTLFLIISCIVEEPRSDVTITSFTNTSGYKIEMQGYYGGNYQDSYFIENTETTELKFGNGEPGGPIGPQIVPFFFYDSVRVYYYEEAFIWHTSDVNSPVSRSLMLEGSYEGGKTGEQTYEFTYTFTPADYEEALEFGD